MFWVYILASKRNGTIYVGSTDDLVRRTWEHRNGIIPGFTKKHGVKVLVWFERHDSREQALPPKKWNRKWKLQLIEASNPDWHDLTSEITTERGRQAGGPHTWVPAFAGNLGRWGDRRACIRRANLSAPRVNSRGC